MAENQQDNSPNKSEDRAHPSGLEQLEASFSTLILSVGSSAAIALGLAPNPNSGQVEKDKHLARFNIDLLLMLKEKTKGNLSGEEAKFLDSLINDLQLKFIQP